MIKQFTYFTEEPDLTEGNTATPSTITDGPEDSAEVPALSPLLNEIEGSTLPVFISWEDEDEVPIEVFDDDSTDNEPTDQLDTVSNGRDQELKCSHCAYTTDNRYYLQRHVKVHSDDKRLGCQSCDYRTSRSDHLLNHIRTHTSEKPFECSMCSFRCAQTGTLHNHLRRRHHKDQRSISCEYCGYRCAIRADMNRHIRRVHEGRCILLGV